MRWHYESDGGGWYEGGHRVTQPKTHYITDGWERYDCDTKKEALILRDLLNAPDAGVGWKNLWRRTGGSSMDRRL